MAYRSLDRERRIPWQIEEDGMGGKALKGAVKLPLLLLSHGFVIEVAI